MYIPQLRNDKFTVSFPIISDRGQYHMYHLYLELVVLLQFLYNYNVWYWQEKQPDVNEEYFFGKVRRLISLQGPMVQ